MSNQANNPNDTGPFWRRVLEAILIELVALPFVLPGGEAIMLRGDFFHGTIGLAIGIAIAFVGFAILWRPKWIREVSGPIAAIALASLIAIAFVLFSQIQLEQTLGWVGLNSPWPDAIKCYASLPENNGKSPLIFYYQGISRSRLLLGDVARYYLVGGFNDAKGYSPHEVWFSAENDQKKNMTILLPSTAKDTLIAFGSPFKKTDLDPITQRYIEIFLPDTDCRGTTIEEIKASGNAFVFARAMK
jgi:hypothetical protein